MRGYAPPVYWEKIGEAKKNLDIPIIANGDIWTREDFLRCREITGSEHFMLGRGVVVNPALSWQVAFELGLVKEIPQIPNWYELVKNFTQKCSLANKNPTYPIDRTKQWLKLSSSRKTFLGFDQIKTAENLSDLLQELRRLVVGHHLHS
jgi:tRNA-dihydrouridine synthase C